MTTVPLNDLARGHAEQATELRDAVAAVMRSGWYVQGPAHDRFEAELAAFLGVDRCLGVASGTDALTLALRAVADRSGGAAVVTAANAGGYTTAAARLNGLRPVYADVSPESLCLTPGTVERALDDEVAAVVVTHLYGRMADVEGIVALCHERGVAVVEDCAQSIGASRDGRAAGSFGDVATFSFYPTKNLGAMGDGGALATSDPTLADRLQAMRQYGWTGKYHVTHPGGTNSRLDEVQAAVLSVRLPLVEAHNERRRAIISRYATAAEGVAGFRVLPAEDEAHAGHLAVAVVEDRDRVRDHLARHGVGTDVHYPVPDHRQPISPTPTPALPVTEHAADHVLSLPCFPQLTDDEVARVCDAIASA